MVAVVPRTSAAPNAESCTNQRLSVAAAWAATARASASRAQGRRPWLTAVSTSPAHDARATVPVRVTASTAAVAATSGRLSTRR